MEGCCCRLLSCLLLSLASCKPHLNGHVVQCRLQLVVHGGLHDALDLLVAEVAVAAGAPRGLGLGDARLAGLGGALDARPLVVLGHGHDLHADHTGGAVEATVAPPVYLHGPRERAWAAVGLASTAHGPREQRHGAIVVCFVCVVCVVYCACPKRMPQHSIVKLPWPYQRICTSVCFGALCYCLHIDILLSFL